MIRALLLAAVLLTGCGASTLGGPCNGACDCTNTTQPLSCAGEWACNGNQTCEYTCKATCDSSGVSTCSVNDDCNGKICSARKGCK